MTTVIVYLTAIFVFGPLLIIEQGWAIGTLWNWFVAPLGAPAIGIGTAIGIALTVGVIRMKRAAKQPERTTSENVSYLIGLLLFPIISVCIGWLVLQFK